MKLKSRQSGLTLMEMTVVIATVALLVAFGLPAVRALLGSLESRAGTRAMISATLASARAIAARQQHYAGIRFQNRYQQDNKGCQYMIFIVQDPGILAYGFRAVEGLQPIKLPETVGVMDLMVRTNHGTTRQAAEDPDDQSIDTDGLIDGSEELRDTTAFSIIFSPSGKLVIHDVRVRNRDGEYQPKTPDDSRDDIFNSPENIEDHKTGMFIQDDYADLGLGAESSRSRFIIYDKTRFDEVDENSRYSDYLMDLDVIHINPYTGRIINK